MAAKSGLGTGLGALIGSKDARAPSESPFSPRPRPEAKIEPGESVRLLPVAQVKPGELQPRKHFKEEQLEELVASIREHGVIQPLIVRPGKTPDSPFELIAGERRWRASQRAGLTTVPVIVRNASDQDVLEMALIENLQREDLDPIEEAHAYIRLAKEFNLRQEDIAKRVGKNRATVANSMRLLDLEENAQLYLSQGRISTGHAKVLLGLKDLDAQREAAESIVKQNLTVRAAERLVSQFLNPQKSLVGKKGTSDDTHLPPGIQALQSRLREHLATSVRLVHSPKKGRLEIEYYGEDDLQRLLDLIGLGAEEAL